MLALENFKRDARLRQLASIALRGAADLVANAEMFPECARKVSKPIGVSAIGGITSSLNLGDYLAEIVIVKDALAAQQADSRDERMEVGAHVAGQDHLSFSVRISVTRSVAQDVGAGQ
ncbi:MAG: hypothetical protein Q4G26_14740 [Paracoccus sp. (in: a-proteobacteria)]|nr:hypothetical protein [Paracoccus sp. (in: a-proteobacteria)]